VLKLLRELSSFFDSASTAQDIMLSWRLALCLAVALGSVVAARFLGRSPGQDAFVTALVVGAVTGIAWELHAAGQRRGYF
jgi:hypothetical protein